MSNPSDSTPSEPTATRIATATPLPTAARVAALTRQAGCLLVWLVFISPVVYSLILVYFPDPDAAEKNKLPGPGNFQEWLRNIDSGPTMVYLIFMAVLLLFTVSLFVRDEPARSPK